VKERRRKQLYEYVRKLEERKRLCEEETGWED